MASRFSSMTLPEIDAEIAAMQVEVRRDIAALDALRSDIRRSRARARGLRAVLVTLGVLALASGAGLLLTALTT